MASVRSIEVSGIALESPRVAQHGNLVDAVARPDSAQDSTGSSRRIAVPADGVVTLPQGTDLGAIVASGRDLIVPLPDGTRLVIVDGAVFVPELVIGSVEVPPATLVALLIGNETQTAAGPPSSSGGNFAVPVGGLGDGYALGDLLPPTALAFPAPTVEQLDVNIRVRNDDAPVNGLPTVLIGTPGNPAGSTAATSSVNEAGLPARGAESPGSNAAAPSETTTGTITYTPGDGPAVLTINGTAVTAAGQAIATQFGVLTITAVRADAVDYSYTLTDNTSGNSTSDLFTVVVTDSDGDTASGTLTVSIIDDVPTANADVDRVAVPTAPTAPTTVSVDFATGAFLTGAPANATSVALDGARLTAVNGVLSVFRGASVLSPSDGAPGQGWTFEIDSTNDQPEALRVDFTAAQSQVRLTLGQLYREQQLSPTPDAERVTVVVGLADGTTVTRTVAATETSAPGEVFVTLSSADFGGRLITSVQVSPDPSPPTLPAGLSPADFAFYSTLVYSDFVLRGISYDLPGSPSTAPFADGNVLTGIGGTDANATDGVADVRGADGAAVTGVVSGIAASAAGNLGTALAGTYGTLTLAADGSYRYMPSATNAELRGLVPGETRTDVFTYTITDGDGDASTTTLTITLDGTDDPIAITNLTPAITGGDVIVQEANLPAGTAPSSAALTQAGDFTIVAPDGYGTVTLAGQTIVSGGGFTPATITTALGNTLTVTGFNAATGVVSYQYTLNGASNSGIGASDRVTETFAVTATDRNGSTTSGSLVATILDDAPIVNADVDSVTVGSPAGTSTTTTRIDYTDPSVLSGLAAGATQVTTGGVTLSSTNGALGYFQGASVLSASDGRPDQGWTAEVDSYNDQPEGLRLSFAQAQSSVRITVGQLFQEQLFVPTPDAEKVTVTVQFVDGTTATRTITATATSGDGIASIALTSGEFGGRLIQSVVLTPDPSTPTLDPSVPITPEFEYNSRAIYSDFVLRDVEYQTTSATPATRSFADGNVLTGIGGTDANATDGVADRLGSDGGQVTAVGANYDFGGTVGTPIVGAYGTLTLAANGAYSYVLNNDLPAVQGLTGGATLTDRFTYVVTDGDGDQAGTTLTITIQPPAAGARLVVAAAPAATADFGASAFAALDRAAERAVEATTAAAITATLVTAAAATATAATTATASAETHATLDTPVASGVAAEPGIAHAASVTAAEPATATATAAPSVDHHIAAAAEPQASHADASVSAAPIATSTDTGSHAAAPSLADIPAPAPAIAFDTAAVAIAAVPVASATTPAADAQVATVVADVLHGGAPTGALSVDQLLASLPDQHVAADQAAPTLTLVADAGAGAEHAALAAAWSAITAAFDSHAMASTGQDGVTAVAHAA